MNQQNILSSDYQYTLPSNITWPGAKFTLGIFTFPLANLGDAGRAVLQYATEHPWRFGIVAALVVGGVLFLTLPTIVGFAATGPVEGSLAALWQSYIGDVVAGSLFAVLQTLTMTGVFDTIGAAMLAAGIPAALWPVPSSASYSYPGGRVVSAAAAAAAVAYAGFIGI